ncbi:hypothetical protein VTN49DRAFT_5650 [Thermomyces lanuginosus]|uniref:uncharacterized protein n=1 Tax=Thermomyces lanuginosus TaxID=5541 RepID=UPI00374278C9
MGTRNNARTKNGQPDATLTKPRTEKRDDNKEATHGDGTNVIDLENDSSEMWTPSSRSSRSRTVPGGRRRGNQTLLSSVGRRSSGVGSGGKLASSTYKKTKNSRTGKVIDGSGRNKTLTQMKFVRRIIVLDDSDEEPGLDYIDGNSKETRSVDVAPKEQNGQQGGEAEYGSGAPKKRKFEEISSSTKEIPASVPSTPQKKETKFEIPSSQTPETPRQKYLPSPAGRGSYEVSAWISSVKSADETLENADSKSLVYGQVEASLEKKVQQINSTIPKSPNAGYENVSKREALETQHKKRQLKNEKSPPMRKFERTVVYETDAETDYGEIDDDIPETSSPPGDPVLSDNADAQVKPGNDPGSEDSASDDADDLPPNVPNSGTNLEGNDTTDSEAALPSDASICYRRPPQFTQFATGPVPLMNTQKMAELFPSESRPLSSANRAADERTERSHQAVVLCPQTQLPTQGMTQTQPQSQDAPDGTNASTTEVIPESSPVRAAHDLSSPIMTSRRRPSKRPVVHVESSQLVDRLNRQNSSHNLAESQKLIVAGQWLTDSVMESIPPPPWMQSQDSVGELYPIEGDEIEDP